MEASIALLLDKENDVGALGKEKVCYWLSNNIVGLVGNLVV